MPVHNPFAEAEFKENKNNYEANVVHLGNRSNGERRPEFSNLTSSQSSLKGNNNADTRMNNADAKMNNADVKQRSAPREIGSADAKRPNRKRARQHYSSCSTHFIPTFNQALPYKLMQPSQREVIL